MANKKLKLPNTKYAVVNISNTSGDNTNSVEPLAWFTKTYADKIIDAVDFGSGGGTGGGDVTREQFNNEVQARTDRDSTLTTNLNKEIQDRKKADSTLQNNIDDEMNARTTDIENVNSSITTERDARITADNSINQKLAQETRDRKQENQTINNSINEYWKTIYPVGSIYISTSSTFNPQTAWGGVWTSIAEGRCLIGANDEYPLGSTGGEKTHTLIENELPLIEGRAFGVATYNSASSGQFNLTKKNPCNLNAGSGTNDLSDMYFGFGNNLPHNNMQPYLAVYMWKRTA